MKRTFEVTYPDHLGPGYINGLDLFSFITAGLPEPMKMRFRLKAFTPPGDADTELAQRNEYADRMNGPMEELAALFPGEEKAADDEIIQCAVADIKGMRAAIKAVHQEKVASDDR